MSVPCVDVMGIADSIFFYIYLENRQNRWDGCAVQKSVLVPLWPACKHT